MLSADILLKGLGGLAVVGGATTVGVFYLTQNKTEKLSDLAERVGLSCTFAGDQFPSAGVVCNKSTKADSKVKVKKDTDSFEATSISGGKIKAYEDKTYNKGFKFVIEEADVTTNDSNKLEEFETYEIKEDESNNKELRLTRKTDVNAGIKKALGLPENCNLPTTTTASDCDISGDKFKKINFDGGDDSKSVTGAPKLKISKVETTDNDYGTYKFKFVLESAQNATISKTVTIKANTNTEFKIKANPATGGTKTLTLEKAWTVKSLGEKVGLTCPEDWETTNNKECSLKDSNVNVNNGEENKKFSGLSKKNGGEKKVKYEFGQEGHSQGFKFFTDESTGIELQNGTGGSDENSKKIEPKGSNGNQISYQILKDADGKWYLTKKTTTPGGGT